MIIEILLRMLTGFFSKAGGILMLGFLFGSLTVVHWDSYMLMVEFLSTWFLDGVRWFLGMR